MTALPTRRAFTVGLAAAATAFASGVARAADPAHIRFTLPSTSFSDAPYMVAKERGYFADEGLDVEFVISNGGIATPALMSGNVDASASGASAISAIVKGAPLRVVAILMDHPAYQLWATRDIKTLADLKGKQVGLQTRGDAAEIAMRLALQRAGLSPDAVGYQALGTSNAAGAAFSPSLPSIVLSKNNIIDLRRSGLIGNAHLLADFTSLPVAFDGMAVSVKSLTERPDIVRRLMRAVVKGSRYIKAFKKQSIAIVLKYQKSSNAEDQALEYDGYLAAVTPDLSISPELQKSDLEIRANLINVPREAIPPIEHVYDFGPLRAAILELDRARWKPAP